MVEVDPSDPTSPPPVCDKCRVNGLPQQKREFRLPLNQQAALKVLVSGGEPKGLMKKAAATAGVQQNTVKGWLNARSGDGTFRRVYCLALEHEGLDIASSARILGEAAKAEEHKWNPTTEKFDAFPDHRVRLNVVKHVDKLMQREPPTHHGPQVVVPILINHNLGKGEEIDPPGHLRVKPPLEVVDIE